MKHFCNLFGLSFCIEVVKEEILKMMVLLSSENVDGSGVLGATKEFMKIQKRYIWGAKIIKTCEEFDNELIKAMKKNNVSNVFESLKTKIGKSLDKEIANMLMTIMPLYSVGCKLQLSNNHYAIVIEDTNKLPIIKDLDDSVVIDLNRSKNLTIKRIIGKEIKFADLD